MKALLLIVLLAASAGTLRGDLAASANYALTTATNEVSGSHRSASANYRLDSTSGQVQGELATSANYALKTHFVGQLYDPVALGVTVSNNNVDEGGTRQVGATVTMDDASEVILTPGDVAWSVASGPLRGVSAAGLATAGLVYQDVTAEVQGDYLTLSDRLTLTVINTDIDNLGPYGSDGLDDAWQVNFFGLPPNAEAAPGANPDGDPHNNRVEFLTGYDPTDSGDFFRFGVVDKTGLTATLRLSKIIPGTRYRLDRSSDLDGADPWTEFTSFVPGSEQNNVKVVDPASPGARFFYRVGVEPE